MAKQKYALIVGASRGIGRAIAIHLSRLGYKNILIGRDKAALEETAEQSQNWEEHLIIIGDINTKLDSIVEHIKAETDEINFLWLGAAGYNDSPLTEVEKDDIKNLVETGYTSLMMLTHEIYDLLKKGRAHVVGAASDWSDFKTGGPSVFGSIKVALAGFLDKLSKEAIKDNIKVTALKMGNVASVDYTIDESAKQIEETGDQFVTLKDICEAIEFIVTRDTALIPELTIIPKDPNY